LECQLITPRVDDDISNELPCHVHWAVSQSESWTGISSSQSVRYTIHFYQIFLKLQNACMLISLDCVADSNTHYFLRCTNRTTMTRWFIICPRPSFMPLFYPFMNCIGMKSFPLIKPSPKSLFQLFNWTCFYKQFHGTCALPHSQTLHGKLNYKMYAAFQSHTYSHPLVALYPICKTRMKWLQIQSVQPELSH
jgi:hypothetical protein